MKKILLSCIAVLGLAFATYAQGTVKVTRKGGGSAGFDKVEQTTDAKGNTVLTCTGAGHDLGFVTAPPNGADMKNYNVIIRHVSGLITSGKLTGNEVIEGQQAEWKGTDMNNYTLTIGPPKK